MLAICKIKSGEVCIKFEDNTHSSYFSSLNELIKEMKRYPYLEDDTSWLRNPINVEYIVLFEFTDRIILSELESILLEKYPEEFI